MKTRQGAALRQRLLFAQNSMILPRILAVNPLLRTPSHAPIPRRLCAGALHHFHAQGAGQAASGTRGLVTDSAMSPYAQKDETEGVFKLFYNDIYHVELPANHRFPMGKYKLVRESIQAHTQAATNIELEPSPLVRSADLRTTHCPEYIKRFLCNMLTPRENRNIGFPWSPASVKRALSSVGGTVAAAHAVCGGQHQFSGHIAGGTHHAFYDYGEGFCVFSDIAVACNVVLRDYPEVERILIIDCDVHQGNGNAVLFAEDPRVTTFSMQCNGNYFSERQASDFDVDLPVGCTDQEYLGELEIWLPRMMAYSRPQIIFYQAGVDPLIHDKMGKCALSREGLQARNAKVYEAAMQANCRVVVTMGGGYPKDVTETSREYAAVVNAHTDVYIQAAQAAKTAAGAV